jgi:hypothetical protein
MLLDAGVSPHELTHVVRWTYVNQSAARLRASGRRTSVSSIAAATGLTRADVRQLLTESPLRPSAPPWAPRASDKVLAGWVSDPDFLEPDGNPRPLAYADGDHGFSELVRRYSQDIPPRAMLNELIDSRRVTEVAPGHYLPLPRRQRPSESESEALDGFGTKLNCLGATLLRNLRDTEGKGLYDSLVLTRHSSSKKIAKIARDLERRCRVFSQAVERYLFDQTAKTRDDGGYERSECELGVIVAVVERHNPSAVAGRSQDVDRED